MRLALHQPSVDSCNSNKGSAATVEKRQHQFLDLAKMYDWVGLGAALAVDNSLINTQLCKRWTALHQAVRSGEKYVVEWLLSLKADTNMKNADNKTPLDLTKRDDIILVLRAATEGYYPPTKPTPTAVGGYLPRSDGGNDSDYFWPKQYAYEQTFQYLRIQADLELLCCSQ